MRFGMNAHRKWNSLTFLLMTMATFLINASNLEMSPQSPLCTYVCRCDYKNLSVNCTHSSLKAVPGAIPLDVKTLSLANNKIRIIQTLDFSGLNQVTKLILASNQIMIIEQGAFKDMYRLQYLNLNDNNLLTIPSGIFQHLPSLERIELRRNSIEEIKGDAFLFLPKLKEIRMGMNPIKCTCRIKSFLEYLKRTNMSHVYLEGQCDLSKEPLMSFNNLQECRYRNIFTWNLNCSTCMDNNCHSERRLQCFGEEPACMNRVTMEGFTLRSEKSCSTYKNCITAESDNVANCKGWNDGTSCVSCCIKEMCNTRDFAGWTHTFNLQLEFMMDNVFEKPTSQSETDLYAHWTRILKKMLEKELLNQNGTFSVIVQDFRLPKITVIIKIICTVPIHIDELQVWHNILNILNTSKSLENIPFDRSTIRLTGKMLCMGETLKDDKGVFHWPTAKVGTNVQLPCLTNNQVTTRKCENITTVGAEMESEERDDRLNDPEAGEYIPIRRRNIPLKDDSDESTEEPVISNMAVWARPNSSKCRREDWITRELEDLDHEEMDDDSIEQQSARLLNISQNAIFFKKIDVELSVKILERFVPYISNLTTRVTTGNVLPILNNMIDTPEKSLIQAEEAKLSANKLLEMADSISERMQLDKSELSVSYSNLDVGIVRAVHTSFQGATFVMDKNNSNGMPSTMTVLSKRQSSFKESDELSISLPETLFDNMQENVNFHISRITFILFKQDKLFKVIGEAAKRSKTTKSDSFTNRKANRILQRINSQVLAATVPGVRLTNLKDPVKMRFRHLSQNASNPQCVFWQDSSLTIPHWSTEGCSVLYTIPGRLTVCECLHLTSFALLMDIYNSGGPVDPIHSKALSMLSFIGCGISFFALLITISTYLGFRKLRSGAVSHILVSLCITLAASNLIFVVGMQPYTLTERVACKIVAVLLHYTLLASMMWMAIEAIHIYLALVVVFRTYLSHFIIRCSLFAWGLPLGIVALTLGINNTENYILKGKICWLSQSAFYASFLFPISVVLLFNVSIFCIIVWRLLAMQKIKKYEHNRKKIRLIGIVGVFFLLGLTWTMAFLAVGEAGLIFNYLFTIFNSLQGLFIFVFYCLYKKESRENLIQLFQCLQRSEKSEKFNTKLSAEAKPSKKSKDIRSRKSYNSESNVNSTENSNAAYTDDNNVITKL